MYCNYFESEYDIGVCNAADRIHIPGIDEMSRLCFKDDYRACSIFQKNLVGMDLLRNDGDRSHQ
jgi:hypothetical protein